MNVMLYELLRWQRPTRSRRAANQWMSWTQALTTRHERLTARYQLPSLLLAQRDPASVTNIHHWEQQAVNLSPHLHLAIHAILPAMAPATMIMPAHEAERVPERGSPGSSRDPSLRVRASDRTPADRARVEPRSIERVSINKPLADRTPLQLVFARAAASAPEVPAGSGEQRTGRLVQHNVDLIRRIVRERQRVEERTQRTVVVQHKREQAASQIDRDPFSTPTRHREDASRERQPVQPPPINIDQLTEQVARQLDRRIQAYRERTGKV
jgi:hypothetical protein